MMQSLANDYHHLQYLQGNKWRDVILWGKSCLMVIVIFASMAALGQTLLPDHVSGQPNQQPDIVLQFVMEAPQKPDNGTDIQTTKAPALPAEDALAPPEPQPEHIAETVKPPVVEADVPPETPTPETAQEQNSLSPSETLPVPQQKPEIIAPQKPPEVVQRPQQSVRPPAITSRQRSNNQALHHPVGQHAAQNPSRSGRAQSGTQDAYWHKLVQRRINAVKGRFERRLRGVNGVAVVRFYYDQSGVVSRAQLVSSSGHSQIDAIAPQIVSQASPIPAPPNGQAGSMRVRIKIN